MYSALTTKNRCDCFHVLLSIVPFLQHGERRGGDRPVRRGAHRQPCMTWHILPATSSIWALVSWVKRHPLKWRAKTQNHNLAGPTSRAPRICAASSLSTSACWASPSLSFWRCCTAGPYTALPLRLDCTRSVSETHQVITAYTSILLVLRNVDPKVITTTYNLEVA